jgi:hypothetical protein
MMFPARVGTLPGSKGRRDVPVVADARAEKGSSAREEVRRNPELDAWEDDGGGVTDMDAAFPEAGSHQVDDRLHGAGIE